MYSFRLWKNYVVKLFVLVWSISMLTCFNLAPILRIASNSNSSIKQAQERRISMEDKEDYISKSSIAQNNKLTDLKNAYKAPSGSIPKEIDFVESVSNRQQSNLGDYLSFIVSNSFNGMARYDDQLGAIWKQAIESKADRARRYKRDSGRIFERNVAQEQVRHNMEKRQLTKRSLRSRPKILTRKLLRKVTPVRVLLAGHIGAFAYREYTYYGNKTFGLANSTLVESNATATTSSLDIASFNGTQLKTDNATMTPLELVTLLPPVN